MQILSAMRCPYNRRKFRNSVGLCFSFFSVILGLSVLLWILLTVLLKGLPVLSTDFFLNATPAPEQPHGGLSNAIVGSLLIVASASFISTPIGIFVSLYLFDRKSVWASVTRFFSDVMLSAPSILVGLFVYGVAVSPVGHFSGWAGSLALSLIAVPVVIRTTENMLRLVPTSLCEAAFALGAPRWRVSYSVLLRAARRGITTGVLLSVARISGETAPLLFTALNNQFFSLDMSQPMATLPVVIYQFAMSPYEDLQRLAWGGALLISLFVLVANFLANFLFFKRT